MFGQPFLYYLVDELGRSIKWLGSTITRKATPTRLDYTPDGWMDKSLQLQRNGKYFGLFREFVPKLNFVRDGAAILRYFYLNFSVEAKLWLVILRREQTTGTHIDLFKGEVDFTQYSDKTLESGAGVVSANCLDGGIPKYLKANESTAYDIDLVDEESVKVTFHGLGLYGKCFWGTNEYLMVNPGLLGFPHLVPMGFLRVDGKTGGYVAQSQAGATSYVPGEVFMIRADYGDKDFDVNIAFDITVHRDADRVSFYLWDGIGPMPAYIGSPYTVYDKTTATAAETTLHVEISQSMTILQGNLMALFAYVSFAGPLSGDYTVTYDNLSATTEGINAPAPSVIRGYTARQMFDKLFTKVTEGNFLNRSTLLDGKDDYILICEDELRGYPNPKYRTEFKKFFDFCRVQFMAGFGQDGRYGEMERLDFFFDTTQISDLGDVKGVKIGPYNEQLYSSVKIGYEDINLSDTNGANDPNNNLSFSSPLKRPGKTLELISPYAASMYLIEYLRIETKDVSEDKVPGNKIFVVKIDRSTVNGDGSYNLLLHPDWTVSGLIDPATAFNLDLTPKRLLKENGDFIASFCHRYENGRLTFTSSQKPIRMITDDGSEVIDEHNNEYINSLGTPIFLPYEMTFDVALPMLTWDQLVAARKGTFQFNVRGNTFTGFAQDVKVKPATDEEQEMTVLIAPGNDLTTLINAE